MLESEDEGQSGNVTWSDSNHWAAAIIGLFGAQGKMMAMTPSLIAHTPTYKAERLVPNYEANDAEEEYLDDPEGVRGCSCGLECLSYRCSALAET